MMLRAKLHVRWAAGFGLSELHQLRHSQTGFVIILKKNYQPLIERARESS